MFDSEVITSRQNRKLVMLASLEDKKHRDAEGLFRYDGIKLFCESLRCGVENVYVFLRESTARQVFERCENLGAGRLEDCSCRCILVRDDIFNKISSEKSPEGIICIAKVIDKFHKIIKIDKKGVSSSQVSPHEIPENSKLIMLESVRDPGNLGTIIRSAFALGIDGMIISDDCADIYNPRTVRAAMGALFRLPIYRTDDLCGTVKAMKPLGRRFLATALNGKAIPISDAELCKNDIIIIGNEGHGISEKLLACADENIYIPMIEGAESLNAAMAATVCIYELGRCSK